MASRKKTPRPSRKNLPHNADWMDDRLSSMMLDIDALSSMPIDDVKAELHRIAPDAPDLAARINERLPEGAGIPRSAAATPRKRTRTQRPADRPATSRTASFRWFSLRGALVLSAIVILAAVLIPQGIRSLREAPPNPATIVQGGDESPGAPTWIEGPAENELLRGVRYRVDNLDRVTIETPLPTNPGALEAVLRFRITVDESGRVARLESLSVTPHEMEAAVIDSLLNWRFRPVQDAREPVAGIVTIEFVAL